MTDALTAYADLPADDRLETRLPKRLKQDAERAARAKGQTLSQWLLAAIAEKVSEDSVATQQWHLSSQETARPMQLLAAPAEPTPALLAARATAIALLGDNPQGAFGSNA